MILHPNNHDTLSQADLLWHQEDKALSLSEILKTTNKSEQKKKEKEVRDKEQGTWACISAQATAL
jgi:hypothetical protein